MRANINKLSFRNTWKGLVAGILIFLAVLFGFYAVFRPFVLFGDFGFLLYWILAAQGLFAVRFVLRRDWAAVLGLGLSWPLVWGTAYSLVLWLIPAFQEVRGFFVHYERFYRREVSDPSEEISTLTLLLGRTECDLTCAKNLFGTLGLDYLGIVNVRLGGGDTQIEVTRDGVRVCGEYERRPAIVSQSPFKIHPSPNECMLRREWTRRTPRIDVFYYAPEDNPDLGALGEQYLLMTQFPKPDTRPDALARWEVGQYPNDPWFRHLHGQAFTLDDALSQLFDRKVAIGLSK